jgi:hypothetical protein
LPADGTLAEDVQLSGDLNLGAALGEELGGPFPTGLAEAASWRPAVVLVAWGGWSTWRGMLPHRQHHRHLKPRNQ